MALWMIRCIYMQFKKSPQADPQMLFSTCCMQLKLVLLLLLLLLSSSSSLLLFCTSEFSHSFQSSLFYLCIYLNICACIQIISTFRHTIFAFLFQTLRQYKCKKSCNVLQPIIIYQCGFHMHYFCDFFGILLDPNFNSLSYLAAKDFLSNYTHPVNPFSMSIILFLLFMVRALFN